jgi:hypothetical protein
MALITLVGSNTPSTFLARGARVTVERTAYVDKLIRRGYVNVVYSQTSAETVEAQPSAPAVNALKAEWSNFLEAQGISYIEGATKQELISIWKRHNGA